ncbi:unnamed protein product [Amoebophrya sp. A120]|nr:unnamed protein product [Amoebophrya sp. A120]|eukprot:GSA120T00005144001.1
MHYNNTSSSLQDSIFRISLTDIFAPTSFFGKFSSTTGSGIEYRFLFDIDFRPPQPRSDWPFSTIRARGRQGLLLVYFADSDLYHSNSSNVKGGFHFLRLRKTSQNPRARASTCVANLVVVVEAVQVHEESSSFVISKTRWRTRAIGRNAKLHVGRNRAGILGDDPVVRSLGLAVLRANFLCLDNHQQMAKHVVCVYVRPREKVEG